MKQTQDEGELLNSLAYYTGRYTSREPIRPELYDLLPLLFSAENVGRGSRPRP